jgi:hypothetical protein
MMGERQPVRVAPGKHRMPQATRRCFKPFAAAKPRHLDANDCKRYPESPTEGVAERGPGVGVGTQTMINVHSRQIDRQPEATQGGQCVHQDHGIPAAGKAYAQAISRQPACIEECRERLKDLLRSCRQGELSVTPAL